MADLSSEGKFPLVNELFTRSAMIVAIEERMSRSRLVGIGSREHEAFDAFLMMAVISSAVVSLNEHNFDDDGSRRESSGGAMQTLN